MANSTWPELHAGTNFNYCWNTSTLMWEKETCSSGGGGGGAVTIADGADVTQGSIGDAAVFGDNPGTVNAHLRGIGAILFDVWDDVLNAFRVTVLGTVATTEPYILDGTDIAPPAGDNVRIPTGFIGYDAVPPGVGGIGRYGMAAMTNSRGQHVNIRHVNGEDTEEFSPQYVQHGEPSGVNGSITGGGSVTTSNFRFANRATTFWNVSGTYVGTLKFQENHTGGGFTDILVTDLATGTVYGTLPSGFVGTLVVPSGRVLRVTSVAWTSGTADIAAKNNDNVVGAWVAAIGPLTDAELRATPVPVSGTVVTGVGSVTTIDNGAGAAAVNIQDGGNSLTVDAVDLDIRDLVFATDKVDVSGSTVAATVSGTVTANQGTPAATANRWPVQITDGVDLALVTPAGEQNVIATAQPGVDIGDVTVNNGAGAAAVNIQDGGNSITVDATDLDVRDLDFATDSVDVSGSTIAISGTATTAGALTNNNAAPGANNMGVLPARATAADPTYIEGNQVLLSVDLEGHQRVTQGPGAALTSGWPVLSGSNAITTTTWTAPSGAVNVVYPCDGYASVAMRLTATAASATIQFDVSMDGVVWSQFSMAWWATGITGGSPLLNYGPTTNFVFVTNTVNLALQANLAGFKFFRVSATGAGVTAGTIVFDTAFSAMPAPTTARQIATVSGDSAPGISTWPTSASSREISVLTVRANAAAPTWIENTKEPLSSDLSGRLRVLSTPVASPGVIIGTVAIDQTTPGTTNLVSIGTNGVISTKTDLTPSAPTFATVGIASAQAVAANANRKGLILTNTHATARISLGFGSAAVLLSGVTLYPGGVYYMGEYDFDLGAVNAIASLVGSNLAIQEYTT